MKTNKSKYALLGILKYQAMSGYDLKKTIDNSISNFWMEDYGRIYTELRQMEKEGLVVKTPEIKEAGPDRNIYSITAAGEKELEKWMVSPIECPPPRNELLLRIFFGRSDLLDSLIQKIELERKNNRAILDKYGDIDRRISDEGSSREDAPFWTITLLYGKHKAEATLKWCDEALDILKAMKTRRK